MFIKYYWMMVMVAILSMSITQAMDNDEPEPDLSSPSTSSSEESSVDMANPGLFDNSQPHGLNLQGVVNDQFRRRSRGEGTGFSTDVILYARNKDFLHRLVVEIKELIAERMNLNTELSKTKKNKRRMEITDHIEKVQKQIELKKEQIKATQQGDEALKQRLRHNGLNATQLENIPPYSEFPKPTNRNLG